MTPHRPTGCTGLPPARAAGRPPHTHPGLGGHWGLLMAARLDGYAEQCHWAVMTAQHDAEALWEWLRG